MITASNQTETYDGNVQQFTNYSVNLGSVIIRYYGSEADRTAGDNELEVVVNAGTYYVKVEQSNENYSSDPVNALLIIQKWNRAMKTTLQIPSMLCLSFSQRKLIKK